MLLDVRGEDRAFDRAQVNEGFLNLASCMFSARRSANRNVCLCALLICPVECTICKYMDSKAPLRHLAEGKALVVPIQVTGPGV